MTTKPIPADDARRLLDETRGLARRTRLARRVTWLPLLVLGVVVLAALPAYAYGQQVLSDCHPDADGQVCRAWLPTVYFYWLTAMILAYAVIAAGYVRVARARGLDPRLRPYVITGFVFAAVYAGIAPVLHLLGNPVPDEPSGFIQFLFRLADPPGTIGVALLVLAGLERNRALLAYGAGYLLVVLVPINFGWGAHWMGHMQFLPPLVIAGGLLLLGSAGFAVAQRRRPFARAAR